MKRRGAKKSSRWNYGPERQKYSFFPVFLRGRSFLSSFHFTGVLMVFVSEITNGVRPPTPSSTVTPLASILNKFRLWGYKLASFYDASVDYHHRLLRHDKMAGLISKLLALPYFVFSVGIFYWSTAIAGLLYRFKWAQLQGPRKDTHEWSAFMVSVFRVNIYQLGNETLYKKGRCVYLCNHRSWADFFLDIYLTEGYAAPMSRALVFFAFPFFMVSVVILKGIILFKRGTVVDKQKFNKWLDERLDSSVIPGLLVYPEGHRSTKRASLPLKRGMMYYAHSRGLPVQIVMTRSKEDVLSEKRMRAGYGATLVTSYSSVIQSIDYASNFEAFSAEIQKTWDAKWAEVYASPSIGLPPLRQTDIPRFDYPMSMRLQHAAYTAFSGLFFLALILFTLAKVVALLAMLPFTIRAWTLLLLFLSGASSFVSSINLSDNGWSGTKVD